MTPITNFLQQMPALRRRAFAHTCDTNEAYLLVHGVMASTVGVGGAEDYNLALTRAIAHRALHPGIDAAPA